MKILVETIDTDFLGVMFFVFLSRLTCGWRWRLNGCPCPPYSSPPSSQTAGDSCSNLTPPPSPGNGDTASWPRPVFTSTSMRNHRKQSVKKNALIWALRDFSLTWLLLSSSHSLCSWLPRSERRQSGRKSTPHLRAHPAGHTDAQILLLRGRDGNGKKEVRKIRIFPDLKSSLY